MGQQTATISTACAAALLGLLVVGCNGLFYHPDDVIYHDPRAEGHAVTGHRVPLSGRELDAWHLRSPAAERKGLVVHFHGNARNITSSYNRFDWMLYRGYDLFVFDYAGYGRSTGQITQPRAVEDGAAVMAYVEAHYPVAPGEQLIVIGTSLGGTIAVPSVVTWGGEVDAIVLDCTFLSFPGVIAHMMARDALTYALQPLAYLLVYEEVDNRAYLDRLEDTPLLVTHCIEDGLVPIQAGVELYEAAPTPKWRWWMEGCGHTRGFDDEHRGNRDRLIEFFEAVPRR